MEKGKKSVAIQKHWKKHGEKIYEISILRKKIEKITGFCT